VPSAAAPEPPAAAVVAVGRRVLQRAALCSVLRLAGVGPPAVATAGELFLDCPEAAELVHDEIMGLWAGGEGDPAAVCLRAERLLRAP
jgi:hypothetical protein